MLCSGPPLAGLERNHTHTKTMEAQDISVQDIDQILDQIRIHDHDYVAALCVSLLNYIDSPSLNTILHNHEFDTEEVDTSMCSSFELRSA